jgi:hypothetical protein
MGPIGCPETSVRNYHFILLKSQKSAISFIPRRKHEITNMYCTCFWVPLGSVPQVRTGRSVWLAAPALNYTCSSVLVFYQRYAGATHSQLVHHHAMYLWRDMNFSSTLGTAISRGFSECLLDYFKHNNPCLSFKQAAWSSDSWLDVWNISWQNIFRNIGYLGWGFQCDLRLWSHCPLEYDTVWSVKH